MLVNYQPDQCGSLAAIRGDTVSQMSCRCEALCVIDLRNPGTRDIDILMHSGRFCKSFFDKFVKRYSLFCVS